MRFRRRGTARNILAAGYPQAFRYPAQVPTPQPVEREYDERERDHHAEEVALEQKYPVRRSF